MDGVINTDSPARRYGKSSIIVYQGEVPRDVFYVKEGVVKVYQIGSAGESRTITFATPGDIFPVAWLVGQSTPAMYYYEAFSDTDLISISRESWETSMAKPEAKEQYARYVTRNYQASLVRIAALEQPKARDKIAYTLLYLILRHSREIMNGVFRLELKLKHQDIAEMVGITRETTAIELHNLQKESVLSYQNQRYLIKREKLLNILNEDSLRQLEL
jgi:CRP/FNR family transcriptional regulator, cyclic AMP receptor protein